MGGCFSDVLGAKAGRVIVADICDPDRVRRLGVAGLRRFVARRGVILSTPGAVGQVPAAFKAGSGTIVTGTAADQAKAAAVAAYPGGTVNRVVLLSDGTYNVHIIGVNWPHHVLSAAPSMSLVPSRRPGFQDGGRE